MAFMDDAKQSGTKEDWLGRVWASRGFYSNKPELEDYKVIFIIAIVTLQCTSLRS